MTEPAPSRWSQVPAVSAAHASGGADWLGRLCAVALAAVGPVLRADSIPNSSRGLALQVLLAVIAASIVLDRVPDKLWPVRLVTIGVASAVLLPGQGRFIALWVLMLLGLLDWAVRRRPTLPFLQVPDSSALAPVAVLVLVSAWQGNAPHRTWIAFLPLVVAGVVAAGAAWGGPVHRFVNALGDLLAKAVGRGVSLVVFGLLGIVVVILPWLFQRVLRLDPLTATGGDGWLQRHRRDPNPTEPWALEPIRRTGGMWRRVREALPTFAIVTAAVLGYRYLEREPAPSPYSQSAAEALGITPGHHQDVPAAMADADWYQEMFRDLRWITDDRVAWNLLTQYRFDDVKTEYVNIRDGHRLSWAPPDSGRKRLTVWFYGGSTAFGVDQRDEHTIASELAQVAHDHGIDLDMVNRGVNAQTHWLEANRFAWDLTLDPKPDLVVFYDGFNELWSARQLNSLGFGDRREPLDPMIADLEKQMLEDAGAPPTPPKGNEVLTKPVTPTNDPVAIGELAARRYEQSRQMSATTARGAAVPIRWFWQPNRFSRPMDPTEPHNENLFDEEYNKASHDAAHEAISDEVYDLYDSLDDVKGPIFTDDAHHNERAARVIAEAMFVQLQPDLQALLK